MHVGLCQLSVADLEVARNLARIEERVASLPDRVSVALFPEQALTGFVDDDRVADAAIPADGDVVARLRDLATAYDVSLLVGAIEDCGDALYNTSFFVQRDDSVTTYRKRHLWGGERTYLESGGALVTVETAIGEVGLLTCYDLNFVADSAAFAERKVAGLFVVGAWPAAHARNWRLLVRARALDGTRWCVACGRTGERAVPDAQRVSYAGRSMVSRPDGEIHASLAVEERTLVAELNPAVLERQRDTVGVLEE